MKQTTNTDCWCDEKKVLAMNTQQEPTLKLGCILLCQTAGQILPQVLRERTSIANAFTIELYQTDKTITVATGNRDGCRPQDRNGNGKILQTPFFSFQIMLELIPKTIGMFLKYVPSSETCFVCASLYLKNYWK